MKFAHCLLPAFLAIAPCAGADDTAQLKAGVFTPPRMAPEFALQGSDGSALTLAEYRGKVVLLGFGFTSCTEVCPITLATLAQARKKLGADASGLQVVYVTVDPERDDPMRMKEYLASFHPSIRKSTSHNRSSYCTAIGKPCSDAPRVTVGENEIRLANQVGRQDRVQKPNSLPP